MKTGFIFGNWHAWQGTVKIMLSDEATKTLREFATVDDCINWLFLNGDKPAARALKCTCERSLNHGDIES